MSVRKKRLPRAAKALQPKPGAVLLRGVSAEAWQKFSAVAGDRHTTANRLMVQVLNHFSSRHAINAMLEESASDELGQLTHVLEQMAWSDHAFENGHWNWALTRLTSALQSTQGKQLQPLGQVQLYRLSFVLLEISNRLELRALQERSPRKFQAAKLALCFVLAIHRQFQRFDTREEVILYNDACANALIARNLVHESIADSSTQLLRGAEQLKPTDKVKIAEHLAAAWRSEIGGLWRSAMSSAKIKLVERFGLEAMDRLERLTQVDAPASSPRPSFWIDLARGDADLVLLRFDRQFIHDMENWAQRYVVAGGMEDADLESLHLLPDTLPAEITEEARATFRQIESAG